MRVIIDADACPVIREAVAAARSFHVDTVIVHDTAHEFTGMDGCSLITVDEGADSADYKIANLCKPGDIVITQDYGLAAMCLARNARCIDQNGRVYDNDNIDSLLEARGFAAKSRRSGQRLKGPKKRSKEADKTFLVEFTELLQQDK